MGKEIRITHFYHSGFSVAYGQDLLLIIDYWRGEENELLPDREITVEQLLQFNKVCVLISHEHVDHFDPVVYTWREQVPGIQYIVSYDMPVGTRGKRITPGESCKLAENVSLKAYGSTDLGVSFMIDLDGFKIFHAGDLNFWHWRDESTAQEIEDADIEFREKVAPLADENIDIAMFPVDPRQGSMYDAGANYFILTCKPRLMIPMHYFHRVDIALEFARHARCRTTEVMAMAGIGDTIGVTPEEDGYTGIRIIREGGKDLLEEEKEQFNIEEDVLDPNNPFGDSDLPVTLYEDEPGDFSTDGDDRTDL